MFCNHRRDEDKTRERRVKVCMISPYPPTAVQYGIADYTFHLSQALSKLCQVTILADGEGKPIRDRRVVVHRIWKPAYTMRELPRCMFSAFKVIKAVISMRCDIVHVQHEPLLFGVLGLGIFPLLLILFRLLQIPVVLTMHSVIPLTVYTNKLLEYSGIGGTFSTLKKSLFMVYTKSIIKLSCKVIVHCRYAKEILVKHYGVPKSKIAVCKHGFQIIKPVSQVEAKRCLGFLGRKIILFQGFLNPSKGVQHIIKAFPKILKDHPETILIIAGTTSSRKDLPKHTEQKRGYLTQLRSLVRQLNVSERVVFVDRFVPEEELRILISASDVVVLPYEGWVFGVSGVLYRVGSYGKPVVASDIPIFHDDIKNGETGILIPPRNPDHLAKAVNLLLSKPILAQQLGENLKKHARKHDWNSIARATLALYHQILKPKEVGTCENLKGELFTDAMADGVLL